MSESGDELTSLSKTDDSMSETSQESKSADLEKSSNNSDSESDNDKATEKINRDSSDSVTPPPPKLTPVKRRGRPPGSPNKKNLHLPQLQNVMKQRGRGVGRPRGSGRGMKKGIGRGVGRGKGANKPGNLLKNMAKSLSPRRVVSRGRGGMRGRGMKQSSLMKIKMKTNKLGRPRKIQPEQFSSPPQNTPKSVKSQIESKTGKLSNMKTNYDYDKKRESTGSLEGVSILEHEPESMNDLDDDFDNDYNGDSDSIIEKPVDLRNYWIPSDNVKSLLDQVYITDVTTTSGATITFRECPTESGFFKNTEVHSS